MSKNFLKFDNVSFGYENSIENIFENISFQITNGWTGITGVNGSGKSTLLKLACGLLKNNSGVIESPGFAFYNEQRTDFPPGNFSDLLYSYDKESIQLIDKLKLKPDWLERWNTLSHGERKRAQVATAIWSNPDLLAVDEPTNHLDYEAKQLLLDALQTYKGIGLIVSHDREIMDKLCNNIIFVEPPNAEFRKVKLSEAIVQRQMENDYNLKQYELKKLELSKVENEVQQRTISFEKSKKKKSKKNISRGDHDAKAKVDLARLTGKDGSAAKLKKQSAIKFEKVKNELNDIHVKRNYETGITLSGSVSKRNYLLQIEKGEVQLSENRKLVYKNLLINPEDKIALTGINGSGKSTLIKNIIPKLNVPEENITYVPQEISNEEAGKIIKEIKALPSEQLGKLMIIISRLGSDAKRVLATDSPSPGETRKLLLGLGITKEPHIIIMDEPTNHLDLVSIQCLEDALKCVKCALVIVSHDKKFIENLTTTGWQIKPRDKDFELITQ